MLPIKCSRFHETGEVPGSPRPEVHREILLYITTVSLQSLKIGTNSKVYASMILEQNFHIVLFLGSWLPSLE
jgi:hypothetical protein